MVNSVACKCIHRSLIEGSSLCTVKMGGPLRMLGPSSIYVRTLTVSKAAQKFPSLHVVCILSGVRHRVSGRVVFGYSRAVKLARPSGRVEL